MAAHARGPSSASETTMQEDMEYSPYDDSNFVQPARSPFTTEKGAWEVEELSTDRRASFVRRRSIKGAFRPLSLFPLLARASTLKLYHDKSSRRILPSSLRAHCKLLADLHGLAGSDSVTHARRTAIKLIQNTLSRLIRHLPALTPDASAIYLNALNELCDDAVPDDVRHNGLHSLSAMVLGIANMGQKDMSIEIEDCRIAHQEFKRSNQVSLRVAALWYIWLFTSNFGNHYDKLFDAESTREFSVSLAELTRSTYPIRIRTTALNLLWKFENLQPGLLSVPQQRSVWMNMMELTRARDSQDEAFLGFRYLWWYSLFPSWSRAFKLATPHKRKVGLDLYQYSLYTNTVETRRLAYELIYLLANTELWKEMFDDHTCRAIVGEMALFCRADTARINRPSILSQISNITLAISPHVPSERPLGPLLAESQRIALRERMRLEHPIARRQLSRESASSRDTEAIEADEEKDSMCSNAAIVNGPSSPLSDAHSVLSESTLAHTLSVHSAVVPPSPMPSISTVTDSQSTTNTHSTVVSRHTPPTNLGPEKSAYSTLVTTTNLRIGGAISTRLAPNDDAAQASTDVRRPVFGLPSDAYALSEIFPQRLSDSKMFRETLERCDADTAVTLTSASSKKGKEVEMSLSAGTLAGLMENLDVFVLPGESLLDQKDVRAIYSRLVEYLRYERAIAFRELAIQALYVLSILISWTSTMRLPEGPLEVSSPSSPR